MTRRDVVGIGAALAAAAAAIAAVMLAFGELLLHVLVPGPLGDADDRAETTLAHARTPFGNLLTGWGTQLAQPRTVEIALVVLVLALGVVTRGFLAPAYLAVAVVGEAALYDLTVSLVRRPRPDVPRLGPGDPHASYPSGHVAAAVCLYGALAVLAWGFGSSRAVRIPLTLVAVLAPLVLAMCRTYRGFHHPTDVVAGALLGAAWLVATTKLLLEPALRYREVTPGQA